MLQSKAHVIIFFPLRRCGENTMSRRRFLRTGPTEKSSQDNEMGTAGRSTVFEVSVDICAPVSMESRFDAMVWLDRMSDSERCLLMSETKNIRIKAPAIMMNIQLN